MKKVEGDLIKLAKLGKFDVILHGCNCFCTMGAGIARQIKQQFPAAYKADQNTQKGDRNKLGDYSFALIQLCIKGIEKSLIIINGYTQFNYFRAKADGTHAADYEAIRLVFRKINKKFPRKTIGIPKIGAGLAGGDWKVIERIIEEETPDVTIALVVYNS